VCQYKSYEGSYRAAEVVAAAAVGNGVTLALVLLRSEIQTNEGGSGWAPHRHSVGQRICRRSTPSRTPHVRSPGWTQWPRSMCNWHWGCLPRSHHEGGGMYQSRARTLGEEWTPTHHTQSTLRAKILREGVWRTTSRMFKGTQLHPIESRAGGTHGLGKAVPLHWVAGGAPPTCRLAPRVWPAETVGLPMAGP